MVSPASRVPEWALDWFFMATKAYSGGTSDLGFFSGVSIFIGLFGVGFTSVGTSNTGFEGVHGGFGYGIRNQEGEDVLSFALAYNMIVANTLFRENHIW